MSYLVYQFVLISFFIVHVAGVCHPLQMLCSNSNVAFSGSHMLRMKPHGMLSPQRGVVQQVTLAVVWSISGPKGRFEMRVDC